MELGVCHFLRFIALVFFPDKSHLLRFSLQVTIHTIVACVELAITVGMGYSR